MLSLARALGRLAAEGYRPRRTIVIGEWDAEEYTLTGSTEWGEQYEKELRQSAVVCINVDASALGREFAASASPLLVSPRSATRPGTSRTRRRPARAWRTRGAQTAGRLGAESVRPAAKICRSRSSGAARTTRSSSTTWASPRSTSSSTGPTACTTPSTTRTAGWPRRAIPGFLYHAAMAQVRRDAGAPLRERGRPPVRRRRVRAGDRALREGARPLRRGRAAPARRCERLASRARAWSEASAGARRRRSPPASPPARAARSRSARPTPGCSRSNARSSTARGCRAGPWFRHLVYAPLPSYEAETLPAIREAIVSGEAESARLQIQRLSEKLSAATALARKAGAALKPEVADPAARQRAGRYWPRATADIAESSLRPAVHQPMMRLT